MRFCRNVWLFLVAAIQFLRGPLGASAADSPCPDVFQYAGSPGSEYGIITVPNPYPYLAIDLRVSIYVTGSVPSTGSAKLKPVDNDMWKKLAAGCRNPTLFRIDFPVSSQLPTIRNITVNKNVICTGSKPNAANVSTVILRHETYNVKCNSSSLDCPFNIQQSVTLRPHTADLWPQPSPDSVCEEAYTSCGTPAVRRFRRVVDGQVTSPGHWPWHAALYDFQRSSAVYRCGGTFVGTRTIITAAHCVTTSNGKAMAPEDFFVALGRYDLSIRKEEGTQEKYVQRVIIHPQYNYGNHTANIALLILNSSVDYTGFVRPVCLWNPSDTSLESAIGKEGVVVGWGRDENGLSSQKLKMAVASIVSRDACYKQNVEFYMRYLHTNAFCAGFANGSLCYGDSGGGMVIPIDLQDDSKVWRLRGIASYSMQPCVSPSVTIFTDVAQYLDWIRDLII